MGHQRIRAYDVNHSGTAILINNVHAYFSANQHYRTGGFGLQLACRCIQRFKQLGSCVATAPTPSAGPAEVHNSEHSFAGDTTLVNKYETIATYTCTNFFLSASSSARSCFLKSMKSA